MAGFLHVPDTEESGIPYSVAVIGSTGHEKLFPVHDLNGDAQAYTLWVLLDQCYSTGETPGELLPLRSHPVWTSPLSGGCSPA